MTVRGRIGGARAEIAREAARTESLAAGRPVRETFGSAEADRTERH